MTCIIGVIDKKNSKVYMGCDSLGSNGSTKTYRKDKKIFKPEKNKNFLLGFTSSYRMGQLLMYSDIFPSEEEITFKKWTIDHKFMVTELIPKIKKLFEDGNYGKKDEGGFFLIAYKDKLFEVECDFQIGESFSDYESCGCGEYHAKGSLFALEDSKKDINEKIHIGLQSASHFSCGVDKPFYIMNTDDDEVLEFKE
jgi:ATP-dependent protease HslVU (ClpYQ) peptidase subunit